MKIFTIVLSRDVQNVNTKIEELEQLGFDFVVICGEFYDDARVIYREPNGKFDAINFGLQHIPVDTDLVIMNDVDTEIHNIEESLVIFENSDVGLVFARVSVEEGPQKSFYKLLDFIRRRVPITASGELILIRKKTLDKIIPIPPNKAEDSYIMFKVLEMKEKVVFSEDTYVVTERTKTPKDEEQYKRRTVGGLYQALSYSKPPFLIRAFYTLLPLGSPFLIIFGKKGYYWMKGILLGYYDFIRGDKTGKWEQTY